jgi:type IV secretion system protein VirB10
MLFARLITLVPLAAGVLFAQDVAPLLQPAEPPTQPAQPQLMQAPAAQKAENIQVPSGTTVPLSLINAVSTKHSQPGDHVYLETAFPVMANGRIVIPVGSYVAGTVTEVKRPGHVKGRGELYIRFDSLTLPNGVTREFRSRMENVDASSHGHMDRGEGKVESDSNRGGDLRTVAEASAAGASIGAMAGAAASHAGMGIGIGAGAGAAAGLIGVLASRGPDAILYRGSTVEMVLDRPLTYSPSDLEFPGYQAPRMSGAGPGAPAEADNRSLIPGWRRN